MSWLSNLPNAMRNYMTNGGLANCISSSQRGFEDSSTEKFFTYFIHLIPTQFPCWTSLTLESEKWSFVRSRSYGIACVFSLCAKVKVFWIHTFWPVAFVQDRLTNGNRALMQYPAGSICTLVPFAKNAATYDAIPVRMVGSNPQPTLICFTHMFPESFRKSSGPSLLFEKLLSNFRLHINGALNGLDRFYFVGREWDSSLKLLCS